MSNIIRKLLLESVEEAGDHPILLSGGVDSASVLAASLALGRRPLCLTVRTAGRISEDCRIAREMTNYFGLEHKEVLIPFHVEAIYEDVKRLLPFICGQGAAAGGKVIYKVWVEVLRTISYAIEALHRQGYSKALTGFCADIYYGSGVQANKILYYEGFEAWDEYRKKYVEHPLNADWVVKRYAADIFGIDLHDCWVHPKIQQHMFSLTPAELQKPRPKWCTVEAFPEFWQGRWYRVTSSAQVNSGVRDDHEQLLRHPVNTRQRKAVIALYYDIAENLGLNPRNIEKCEKQGDLFSL